MGNLQQSTIGLSFIPQRHKGAHPLWAIQIATVDSLKWRGHNRLAAFLGRNSIEHSYTRMAQIWCDREGTPLKDPETGNLYPPIWTRAELNSGAINPEDGSWKGMSIDPHTVKGVLSPYLPVRVLDSFNSVVFGEEAIQAPKCKLKVLSFYGYHKDGIQPLDSDFVVETPVALGNLKTVEAIWAQYQGKAASINEANHDYDLMNCNCHTANAALNAHNWGAVSEFANRGLMRWGVTSDILSDEDVPPIGGALKDILSGPLNEIQSLNGWLSHKIMRSHEEGIEELQRSDQEQNTYEIA